MDCDTDLSDYESSDEQYQVTELSQIANYLMVDEQFFHGISEESTNRMYSLLLGTAFEPNNRSKYILSLFHYVDNDIIFVRYFKEAIKLKYNIDRLFYSLKLKVSRVRFAINQRNTENVFDRIYYLIIDFMIDEIYKNNEVAMYILGLVYDLRNDQINASKYYKMAIEYKYIPAILTYCSRPGLDKETVIKFYQMGIEMGSAECIIGLAGYYWYQLEDYDQMIKCFKDIFEKYPDYCDKVFDRIVSYIEPWRLRKHQRKLQEFDNHKLKKDYVMFCIRYNHITEKTLEYLASILTHKDSLNSEVIEFLLKLDLEKYPNIPVCIRLIQTIYQEKIDLIALHYQYQPGQAGFKEAKADFDQKIINT